MTPEELLAYRVQRLEDSNGRKADLREVERVSQALEHYAARMDLLIEKHDLRLDELDKSKADNASLRWIQRTAVALLISIIMASITFALAALQSQINL